MKDKGFSDSMMGKSLSYAHEPFSFDKTQY